MSQAYTRNLTEILEPVETCYPITKTPATYNGAWFSMADNQRAIFYLMVGAITATGLVDFTVQQDILGDGAAAKGMGALGTGHTITQLSEPLGDSDDLVAVEVRTEQMDVTGGFSYLRYVLTVTTANALVSILTLLGTANYPPVPTTAYTEIVLV